MTKTTSNEALLAAGMDVIFNGLEVVDALRFLRLLGVGGGDYTAERHQWLDGIDVDEMLTELVAKTEAEDAVPA